VTPRALQSDLACHRRTNILLSLILMLMLKYMRGGAVGITHYSPEAMYAVK
jgi:hypothetical protein